VNRLNFFILRVDYSTKTFHWSKFTCEGLLKSVNYDHQNFYVRLISNYLIDDFSKYHVDKYIEPGLFTYGKNYRVIFFNSQDVDMTMFLTFYCSDKLYKSQSLIIYKVEFDVNYFESKNIKVLKKEIQLNYILSILELDLISMIMKIDSKGEILCYGLSYESNYFEFIVFIFGMNIYKSKFNNIKVNFIFNFSIGFTSSEFFPNNKIDKLCINDIFIQDKFLFVLVNFIYILIIDLNSFTVILNSYENKSSTILNLNQIFKGEYNKTLSLLWKSTEEDQTLITFNEIETTSEDHFLYLYTKKGMKILRINFEYYMENSQKFNTYYSIKKLNSLQASKFFNQIQNLEMSNISKSNFLILFLEKYILILNHLKIKGHKFSYSELIEIYNQNRKLILKFIFQSEGFDNSGGKLNMLIFLILLKNNRNLSMATIFSKKFSTIKFEYFFDFNFTRVSDIRLENSILLSWEDLYLENLVINNNQLAKKLALDDIFIQKDFEYDWSQLIKFKTYELTVVNNFYFDCATVLLFKFHIKGQLDKVKIISQLMTNNEEELKILLSQYKIILKKLMPNKIIRKKKPEDSREEFLKNIFKFFRNKNATNNVSLLNLFIYMKKFYTFKEFLNYIYFTFYLMVFLYKNKNFSLKIPKINLKDLILFLNDPDTKNYYDEAIKIFFNKPSLKINIFYRDEQSTKYLIMTLELILYNTLQIEDYFIASSNQEILIFIFFIQKLISCLNIKNKLKNRMISSQGREKIHSYNISENSNLKIKEKLEKVLINFIYVFLNKNKSCLEINSLMILMHLKTNIKSYKKLITDKIINLLDDEIKTNLRIFVFSMKKISYKDICDPNLKNSITNTNHITPNIFFTFLQKGNFENLNKNKNLEILQSLFSNIKNLLLFLNFIFEKNKHKKEFLNFLKMTNKDKEKIKNSSNKKYLHLLEKIQKIITSIYLSFLVFTLVTIINNSDKINPEQSMINICRCYLILSIYFTTKYPDKDSLFMNEIIDAFYTFIKSGNFDMDFMTIFFCLGDLSYRRDNKAMIIEEIQNIIKQSSKVIYEKLINLNRKKQNFISSKYPLNDFQNFISSIELSQFIYFKECFLDILVTKLLDKKIITSVKNERCKIKKISLEIFANLETLIDFKKLFVHNSQDDNFKLFSKFINKDEQLFSENNCIELDSEREILKVKEEKKQIIENKYLNIEENKNYDEKTVEIKINKQFSNKNTVDESDYSIDNVSNISDLSTISNNQFLTKENNSNSILNHNTIDYETPYEKEESLNQNDFKEKILQTLKNEESNLSSISNIIYYKENESSLVNESLEIKNTQDAQAFHYIPIKVKEKNKSSDLINFSKSLNPSEIENTKNLITLKTENSSRCQISYNDKKKKYISLKMLQNILSGRILYLKEKKFKLIKSIYNNLTNQIEFTQIITLNKKKDKSNIKHQVERNKEKYNH
jgi:hypothetical protein